MLGDNRNYNTNYTTVVNRHTKTKGPYYGLSLKPILTKTIVKRR